MSHTVFFGIPRARVSDAGLLEALARVARDFDESPKSMLCLLAEPEGDVQWFTFVCSVFQRDAAMAAGFFRDVLGGALPEFVMHQRHELLPSDVVFQHYRDGGLTLELRSNGAEVIVSRGAIAASVPREGDAILVGLRALGWSTAPAWEGIGPASREVVLRRDGAPIEPLAITARTKASPRLPPVKVIRDQGEVGFEYFRERASVRFPQKQPAVKAPKKDEVVRLDVRVGRPGAWPDLAAIERVTGRLEVIDSWDPARPKPEEYGLRVVDLGAVRELKYPAMLYVQGACERIVALQLEKADAITLRGKGSPHVALPKLKSLRHGTFGPASSEDRARSELVLPELVEAKKLHLELPGGLFTIRLPKFAKGELTLSVDWSSPPLSPESVLDLPLFAMKGVEIRTQRPEHRAAVERLIRR